MSDRASRRIICLPDASVEGHRFTDGPANLAAPDLPNPKRRVMCSCGNYSKPIHRIEDRIEWAQMHVRVARRRTGDQPAGDNDE